MHSKYLYIGASGVRFSLPNPDDKTPEQVAKDEEGKQYKLTSLWAWNGASWFQVWG